VEFKIAFSLLKCLTALFRFFQNDKRCDYDKSCFYPESAARLISISYFFYFESMNHFVGFEWKSFLWLDKRWQKDWEPFDCAQDKLQADKAAQIIFKMTRLRKFKISGSFFMLVGDNS